MSMTEPKIELTPGVKVRTMLDPTTSGWSHDAYRNRRTEAAGKIVSRHNSHGECYGVEHEDGIVAYYEPQELIIVPPEPIKCSDTRGRHYTVGDEVVYVPRLIVKSEYDGSVVSITRQGLTVSKVKSIVVTGSGWANGGDNIEVRLEDGTVLKGDGENGGWGCLKLEQIERPKPPATPRPRDNAPLEFGGQRYQS